MVVVLGFAGLIVILFFEGVVLGVVVGEHVWTVFPENSSLENGEGLFPVLTILGLFPPKLVSRMMSIESVFPTCDISPTKSVTFSPFFFSAHFSTNLGFARVVHASPTYSQVGGPSGPPMRGVF